VYIHSTDRAADHRVQAKPRLVDLRPLGGAMFQLRLASCHEVVMPTAETTIHIPTLKSSRALRPDDHPHLPAMGHDAEVARLLNEGPPPSAEEVWHRMMFALGQWALRGYGMWAVVWPLSLAPFAMAPSTEGRQCWTYGSTDLRCPKTQHMMDITKVIAELRAARALLLNGVLARDHREGNLLSTAWWVRINRTAPGPCFLQDHGSRVRYRNIWVRRITIAE
jgi:hypothetical protein